jgi:hypothetical protein
MKVEDVSLGETLDALLQAPYTVSFAVSPTGASGLPASQPVYPGGKATQPSAPTLLGYSFDKWYTTNGYTTAFDFATTTINADTTIYGRLLPKDVIVTYWPNYGGKPAYTGFINANGSYGGAISNLPSPTRTGYSFDDWYASSLYAGTAWAALTSLTEANGVANAGSTSPTLSLYAKWTMGTDTDNDGIPDDEEETEGEDGYITDPNDDDTDDDGILDGEELIEGGDGYITDPTKPDSDGDGYPDGWEVDNGYDPTDGDDHPNADDDTDGDGYPDGWEIDNGYDPTDPGSHPDPNADTDGDGIKDGEELIEGEDGYITDPTKPDTDNDGYPDGWEVDHGYDPTDPDDHPDPNADTDGDGILDGEELIKGGDGYITDPTKPDTDGDGYTDGWEVDNGYDPTDGDDHPNADDDTDEDGYPDGWEIDNEYDPTDPGSHPDPNADTDGDGIKDGEELIAGEDGYITDPTKPDSDGDGYSDGWEVDNGYDPTDPDDHPNPNDDTDGDDVTDGQELIDGTDPTDPDSDDDGLDDGEEKEHGTNPNDPDTDKDGVTDGQEVEDGTDPTDPDDYKLSYTVEHYLIGRFGTTERIDTEQLRALVNSTVDAQIKEGQQGYEGYRHDAEHEGKKLTGALSPDSSLVLKVYYKLRSYTVSYNLDGGSLGGQNIAPRTVAWYDTDLVPQGTPVREGYSFKGWDVAVGGPETGGKTGVISSDAYSSLAISSQAHSDSGAIRLDVRWQANTYTLSFDANQGSSGNITQKTVTFSAPIGTLPTEGSPEAPTRTGYVLIGWSDSPTGAINLSEHSVYSWAEDKVAYAIWNERGDTSYRVEHYLIGQNNTASLADIDVFSARTNSLAYATPKAYGGYTLAANHTSALSFGTVSADGSLVLKLYYTINRHSVRYVITGAITNISLPSVINVAYASTVELASVPVVLGYSFSGWSSSDVTLSAGRFVMPDKDITITGSFSARAYTVSYDLSGGVSSDGTSFIASRRVGYNSTGLIPAVSPVRSGYSFIGWASPSDTLITAAHAYSQIVANDSVSSVILSARWQAATPTPTQVSTTPSATPSATSSTSVVPGSTRTQTEEVVGSEAISAQSQMQAQTGNPFVDLTNGNVPLGGLDSVGTWSLANMLMAQLAAILAIIIGMLLLLRRGHYRLVLGLRVAVCVLGLSAPFIWLSADHLNDPMVWLNSSTPVLAVLIGLQVVLLISSVASALFAKRREIAVVDGFLDELSLMGDDPYATL